MNDRWFVPSRTAALLAALAGKELRDDDEQTLITTDGYTLRGYVQDTDRDLLENAGLSKVGMGCIDDTPYLVAGTAPETLVMQYETPISHSEIYGAIAGAVESVFKKLKAYTGMRFTVRFSALPVHNVLEADDDEYHVIIGASPPGATSTCSTQALCGVRLQRDLYWVNVPGHAKGRGRVIVDEQGQSVAQIVDHTIYLLTPGVTEDTEIAFSASNGNLLDRILALVSTELTQPAGHDDVEIVHDEDAYLSFVSAQAAKAGTGLPEAIASSERRMSKYLKQYHEELRHLRNLRAMQRATDTLSKKAADSEAGTWTRLANHPRIAGMEVVEEGLHITTTPVTILLNREAYALGPFVVRLAAGEQVAAWALAPRHPEGAHHPHISMTSVVCLGNAGATIHQAIAQGQYVDAIELVLEWLFDGYDLTLATHPITEWPVATEV